LFQREATLEVNAVPDSSPASDGRFVAHKFGGTSVADAARIKRVAEILLARSDARQAVVVSAMSGVTDALIQLAHQSASRDPAWPESCAKLERQHVDTARALLGEKATATEQWLENGFGELRDLLHAMALLGAPSDDALQYVQGLGEVFSAHLLCAWFATHGHACHSLDAREVLVVRHDELGATVDWEQTRERLAPWRATHDGPRVVITGFVARTPDGRITTLGRNGSDYSGAIFAALFDADALHIWTDVDGVLSADPRLVPEAVRVPELTYAEACELAYFGAKVIHPQTMQPAIARGIPIRIRNTFKPDDEGSLIARNAATTPPVKGTTAIGNLAMVNVEGAGMIGVPGTAERVFAALHRASISVVMISQGSSEHSICCVIDARHALRARDVIADAFARELERGQIQSIAVEPGISVLAVVGEGMAGTPGIAARLFDALARARINVRAIAQGASERNISVALASDDAARALRAVHAGFYLSPQTLSIGVIGPGHVGRALIGQLAAARGRLKEQSNLDLRVRALADSRRMLFDEREIPLEGWTDRLIESGQPLDIARFVAHVRAPHLPHALIIDCSAADSVAEYYAGWLAQGIHVITPNKQAGAGPIARYRAIRAASANGARFRYEATVGAGLPIIQTLRDLIDTGDEIHAIEGIFSGTLAWLFNSYDGTTPFSKLVADARAAGYTEPDPRDDLSGTDVARKLVILAREMGLDLELKDVRVESLVPEELSNDTPAQFLQRLPLMDPSMTLRLAAARSRGAVLRYVAKLDRNGLASVGLVELPATHAFAHIRLTDNIVQFTTKRYRDNPLVVQGPGAGPEVTAAGVFADLLRVAAGLGASL
jgi:bifunctional aspartokinase / homoserine dehydrogenase 1